ncbi:MAG: hypothetical protein WC480_03940 [Patescibacteria group bacterium]
MPNCKNCQKEFTIYPQDKEFYQRIDVPEPTWCPPCREMRRMAWCNEGILYPRKCDLCSKSIISEFSSNNPRKVYCLQCWWEDSWEPLNYGKEIDFSRSILGQIHELDLIVPHQCVSGDSRSINSDYTHHAGLDKNCYMLFHADYNEDCYYGYGVKKSKDSMDIYNCFDSELCYECVDIHDCYHLAWSQDCIKCANSYFLRDCAGCNDCFLCVGLRQKNYCFLNKQLSEKDYQEKLKETNIGSHRQIKEIWDKYLKLQKNHIWRYAQSNKVQNSSGNYLYNSFNVQSCFDCSEIESSGYCSQLSYKSKDCFDVYQFGLNAELVYEGAMIGEDTNRVLFSYNCIRKVANLNYCIECYSTKDSFGSVGLRKREFCILNKKYKEQEYKQLRDKIIDKMKSTGEYGEFFPINHSPFGYNETIAQLWFPLTKEQTLAKGWSWQDNLPGTYGKETIRLEQLSDDIKEILADITQEILACENCHKNYKIIAQELDFYKKNNYPLPKKCFECRRLARMKLRNPRRLYNRTCMNPGCKNKFETTYAPDREEKVYCEECYQKEIY